MSPLVHVDRESLYTSLEARIDYLHRFLDWDERDIEALAYGSSHIRDLIPAVVYIIYHKLSEFDITAHAFEDRNTSLESPSKDQPSSESSLLLQRQSFLNSYLTRLSSDQSSMAFWEYLDCIGAMHSVMSRAILDHSPIPISRRAAIVRSFSKVICIQNDLFARCCQEIAVRYSTAPGRAKLKPKLPQLCQSRKVSDKEGVEVSSKTLAQSAGTKPG
ncbi:hypothetical protein BHE90_004953 [Fusarium euwallaceae]|uniref:Globin-sensor domain-containing protein n=3 Tax=Fusarium solani species complex TaxID=232080 RepID=A0A3M2R1J5_9HYPO|nr:hypothetical protein CDV36_016029 [Fusarium kuroshium]RSL40307.1 hypothetical protein CEP51_016714 [Fusarium floridanum]RTE80582.1 hypothetical protein BHE90_004953 [Fusarium euwallaceae]